VRLKNISDNGWGDLHPTREEAEADLLSTLGIRLVDEPLAKAGRLLIAKAWSSAGWSSARSTDE
jgi:hypothetical protein